MATSSRLLSVCNLLVVVVFASSLLLRSSCCGAAPTTPHVSVAALRYYQEEGDYADDFNGDRTLERSSEEDVKRELQNMEELKVVFLLSSSSGLMVVATSGGDGLRSDGKMSDLGARFESSPVNNDDEDRVTLSTTVSGQKKFLGIDSHGQIVLDAANSPDVVREFELIKEGGDYDDDMGTLRLRAKVHNNYCYLAFNSKNLPLHNTCHSVLNQKAPTSAETVFSIIQL